MSNTLKVACFGDVCGEAGRNALIEYLRINKHLFDFVIANGENSAHGFGITQKIYISGEYKGPLKYLVSNLKETRKELNVVNITKNMRNKAGYGNKILDQDAHELQIISRKLGWNDLVIPSPINEIFIESIENKIPPRMQYIEGMQIMGNEKMRNKEIWTQKIRTEESIQESVSDAEAVLEIQEMNALSIISNKVKPKNICQHLQSLMILSKKNEEEEPLIFQKIEEINITSIVNKPRNQIQELDGLEIISMKKIPINISQNVDKICIKSLKKREVHNIIQK